MIDERVLAFVSQRRTATLATLTPNGQPRLVPICFVIAERGSANAPVLLYSPLDEKPKRGPEVRELARVRDIKARPAVTLLFDHWSEDWAHLGWVRASGSATLVEPGEAAHAHDTIVAGLRAKYPQYRSHRLEAAPLIRVALSGASSWGRVSGPG
jgi:PPOX class probable F420-dependent enzyme